MSTSPKKFVPGPISKPEEPNTHPGGSCACTRKTRRIVRMYQGHCEKLTAEKVKVR